jgi:integrase
VEAAIKLAVSTGLRRGELLALQWSDVDFERCTLLVRTSKNGRPRTIPMSVSTLNQLQEMKQANGAVLPMSANCLKLAFLRARQAVGTTTRFHDLRHEAISRFFEQGLTMPEVQMISGHRTIGQLSRYSHGDLDRVLSKLSLDETGDRK